MHGCGMHGCGMHRRQAFRLLAGFAARSPLWPQSASGEDDVLGPINVHEFEEVARRKLPKMAYDFIAGGVEDELTLQANRKAYEHWFLTPRVMTDVSNVDTSSELLGLKLPAPILIAPTGGKNLVIPNAESTVAKAATATKTLFCTGSGAERAVESAGDIMWWSNTTGQPNKTAAVSYAKRMED